MRAWLDLSVGSDWYISLCLLIGLSLGHLLTQFQQHVLHSVLYNGKSYCDKLRAPRNDVLGCHSLYGDSDLAYPWRSRGFLPVQATKALRVSRGIALPNSRPRPWRWGWGVNATPRPLYPPGKTRYPFYRRLGGPQGRSGRVGKISPLAGFDPRTV